jgi:hypothetical protein
MPGPRTPEPGLGDIILGIPEAALTLGSGAVAGAVAPFVAVGEEILQGRFGEGGPETERRAAELAQQFTYTPRTRTGEAITGTVGETLQGLGLEAIPVSQGLTAATLAPGAARQAITGYAREAQLIDEGIKSIPGIKQAQEARVRQSYARAPQIDAVNLAQKYGITVDPAEANPTLRNRTRETIVGQSEVADKAAAQNLTKWSDAIKQDLGVAPDKTLNSATFTQLKNNPELTQAYDVVRQAPTMRAPSTVITQLDELSNEVSNVLVGDVGGRTANKLTKTINGIKEQIQAGVDGKTALASIQDLRTSARNIYKAQKAGQSLPQGKLRLAQIYEATADALEQTIDANLKGKALEDYRAARTQYAKIYGAEQATNLVTGQVNPNIFAKMLQDERPLTGVQQEIGQIAATFPSIAKISPSSQGVLPRLTRAGVGGAVGGVVGAMLGGGVGAPIGIAIGAGVGDIARRVAMQNMLRPGYQSRRAVPPDYRPAPAQPNMLRPVEPGQSNIVPFDPRNALVQPGDQGPNFRPDFTMGGEPVFGTDPTTMAAMRALPDPTPGQIADAQRRAELAQMFREQDAPRAPTTGGVELELDPITGQLRPAAAAAAPTAAFEPPPSIVSASEKLSKGQRFALTPEEMVAWNRTSVELAEIVPELNKLSPKAIAEKMMDRKWVESAIQKAREKEAAFKEIEMRTRDQEMLRQARESRERLMDTLETLEEALGRIRPKETARAKGQGPKTRAARNNLREIETLNKLID